MSIQATCPFCENQFQLSDDLAGKSLRCPNTDCREIFQVQATAIAPPPLPTHDVPPPLPTETRVEKLQAGNLSDYVPILDVQATGSAPEKPYERIETTDVPSFVTERAPANPTAIPINPQDFPAEELYSAEYPATPAEPYILSDLPDKSLHTIDYKLPEDERNKPPTAKLIPPVPSRGKMGIPVASDRKGPKEVSWHGDGPPLPKGVPLTAPAIQRSQRSTEDDEIIAVEAEVDEQEAKSAEFVRRRKPRRIWPKILLGTLVVALVSTIGGSIFGYLRFQAKTEERMADEAETAYKADKFAEAQVKYDAVKDKFPESVQLEKYRFFSSLSEIRNTVAAVTVRENPQPAMRAYNRFLEEHGGSVFARPESGFGSDIVQTGRQLADALGEHGGDRLKIFISNRTKLDELVAVEKCIEDGRTLFPQIEKFRDKDGLSLDSQRKRFDDLEIAAKFERHRLVILEPFRKLSEGPTAERIEAFQVALKANKLDSDSEAMQMLSDAEAAFRGIKRYFASRIAAKIATPEANRPILFSTPVSDGPEPRVLPDDAPDRVFAVARGVLYALDARTGSVEWGTRVAPPTADPMAFDLPTRLSLGDGIADWVLIIGEREGKPVLTARAVANGQIVWEQPLPAPAVSRPILVGGRVFLPIRDALGTVLEFEAATGMLTGRLELRQPVGTGIAVLPGGKPDLYYLFIPADARRIFVFEIGAENLAGEKMPPRLVRVMLTEHARDALRGEPIVIHPVEEKGPRYLILSQTDGPQSMRLRAYPLPTLSDLMSTKGVPTDQQTPRAAELKLSGWSWFPALTDGERLVLATDAPGFLVFGVNQLGNMDSPLFNFPGPKPNTNQDGVVRSQVIAADEDAYWAVLAGRLVRLRTIVDASGGIRVIEVGTPRSIGEPIQRSQIRSGLNLGVVVTRLSGAGSVQAIGFDLNTGGVRWQRRLGAQPAGPPMMQSDGSVIIADEDGAIYNVSASANQPAAPAMTKVIARPHASQDVTAAAEKTVIFTSPDRSAVWTLLPRTDQAQGRQLRIRLVMEGVLKSDSTIDLLDRLAGSPVAIGSVFYLPLANGYVYRFTPGDKQLTAGPLWRGSDAGDDATCWIGAITPEQICVSDGNRKFLRWNWPAGSDSKPTVSGGPWESREKLVLPVVTVTTPEGQRLATADASGSILLFNPDNAAETPRRWRIGTNPMEPERAPALPSDQLIVQSHNGKTLIIAALERKTLVAVDPQKPDTVAWTARNLAEGDGGEFAGWWMTDDQRIVVTDQTGRTLFLSADTGEVLGTQPAIQVGALALTAAMPFDKNLGILILSDGTAGLIPLQKQPQQQKK